MSSSESRLVQAIIFDCFGVLYHDGFKEFIGRNRKRLKEPVEYYGNLLRQYDTGFLSEDDFYAAMEAASEENAQTIRGLLNNVLTLNHELVDLMEELKPEFRLGLLTNAERLSLQKYLDNEAVGEMFEVVLASSEVGAAKPDPQIYWHLINRMELEPEQMIFVDDSASHVDAAIGLGMKAHLYKDVPDLQRYLDETLRR